MDDPQLPHPGQVIRYAFLWTNEGRPQKTRPCAVAVALKCGRVMVLPITHTPPDADQSSTHVFIPDDEKRLVALDADPQWIVLNEMNYFDWPSDDVKTLSSGATFFAGSFSRDFFTGVMKQLQRLRETGQLKPPVRR